MEVSVNVWFKDEAESGDWIPVVVSSKKPIDDDTTTVVGNTTTTPSSEQSYEITMTCDETQRVFTAIIKDGVHEDVENVKLRNDQTDKNIDNLINLPYLHEPAILYCLEQRYHNSNIYTYTGPILIAVNPFKKVPLYTTQILETYYNVGLLKSQGIDNPLPLAPHIYAISDAAFRDMMAGIHSSKGGGGGSSNSTSPRGNRSEVKQSNANQAILVSGESGAGKTESTKIVLKYLTTVGNSSGGMEVPDGSTMDKVLQSNPILEAFGNAKTIRNDNSSRFGKYIDLNFNKRGHLIGGTIRTYLLEKVRLPTQRLGERNFHIFYQMAAGGTEDEKINQWKLKNIESYYYTNQGNVYDLAHFDDKEEYNALKKSIKSIKLSITRCCRYV